MDRSKMMFTIAAIFILAAVIGMLANMSLSSGMKGGNQREQGGKENGVIEGSEVKSNRDTEAEKSNEKKGIQTPSVPETPSELPRVITVAWQPSHQDDTGEGDWHEYLICNDIVDRAMALSTGVKNVKCWDISHGLTGTNRYEPKPTNTAAFDAEIAAANHAQADYFISVHNDADAPSGILGLCMPGDKLSRSYLEQIIADLCKNTGLPNRGIWEVRLYSLEPERNSCPVRFILEIGDNVRDREKLMDPDFRELVAQTLASFVNQLPPLR